MNSKQRRKFERKWQHRIRVEWRGYGVYATQRKWLKENCKKGTYYTDEYSQTVYFVVLSDASNFALRFV